MNSADLDRMNQLVIDLLVEFENEANKLQAEYDNSSMRIREIDENIDNYRENEDVDIQVFSPRKLDNKNEVRLNSLNQEKDVAQSSVKDISKQMKYYKDKIKKLREIKSIINRESGVVEGSEVDNSSTGYASGIEDVFNIDEKIKGEDGTPSEPERFRYNLDIRGVKKNDRLGLDKDKSGSREYSDYEKGLIDSLNTEADSQKPVDNSSLISSLSRISHKADVGYKVIDNDSFRAKMEFKSIKSNLEDIINSLK